MLQVLIFHVSGFVQKSDCGFSRTKLLIFRLLKAFFHVYGVIRVGGPTHRAANKEDTKWYPNFLTHNDLSHEMQEN